MSLLSYAGTLSVSFYFLLSLFAFIFIFFLRAYVLKAWG